MKNQEQIQYWAVYADHQIHTDFLTFEEAVELEKELTETFVDVRYDVKPSEQRERIEKDEIRNVPPGAADGWEDLYNSIDE